MCTMIEEEVVELSLRNPDDGRLKSEHGSLFVKFDDDAVYLVDEARTNIEHTHTAPSS